jgi:hypothetical protein
MRRMLMAMVPAQIIEGCLPVGNKDTSRSTPLMYGSEKNRVGRGESVTTNHTNFHKSAE